MPSIGVGSVTGRRYKSGKVYILQYRIRQPVISVDQARALLRELDPDWRAPVVTLALTGLRAGELLGLRWKDIDFLNRRITVSHSLWRRRLDSPKTQASKARVAMPEAHQDAMPSVTWRDRVQRTSVGAAEDKVVRIGAVRVGAVVGQA